MWIALAAAAVFLFAGGWLARMAYDEYREADHQAIAEHHERTSALRHLHGRAR